ncbi:hypothetical protein Verru16b_01491 [Lacunisphaera limnophila]|uniref:Lysozyme inhibitor LprI N-terminal domain-containing protein n=1 Tax=Lacunisphaera limnophila TaxID=1838286 RepID=A0A1D8AU65_9BACT|nr:hypothetical protein [Lacunisphaera limnophila]AOS44429.1 hypothetical protein Verru16b_01491 [Lacunisphaera limnophila]
MKPTPSALLVCLLSLLTPVLVPGADKPPAPAAAPADLWTALKVCTYDNRAVLYAGLPGLADHVDAQIAALNAKRTTMGAKNISTQAWDFAMQELARSRIHLMSSSDDLINADRENWDQLKDQVGLAWVRTQDACGKVKASTTN